MLQLSSRFSVVVIVAFLAGGCGGGGKKPPKTFPVKGKVSFEGKPMAGGGSISFMPTDQKDGHSAGGTINEDGSYSLPEGAVAGDYRVIITQVTEKEPPNTEDGAAPVKIEAAVPVTDRIPPVYGLPMSPLTTKVEEKENTLDFNLTRQGAMGRPPGA